MNTIFKQIQDAATATLPRGALDGASQRWQTERRQVTVDHAGGEEVEEVAAPNVTLESGPEAIYAALQDMHRQYVSCKKRLQRSRLDESKARSEKNALDSELRRVNENSRRIISQERRTVQLLRDAIFTTTASKSLVLTRSAAAAGAGVGMEAGARKSGEGIAMHSSSGMAGKLGSGRTDDNRSAVTKRAKVKRGDGFDDEDANDSDDEESETDSDDFDDDDDDFDRRRRNEDSDADAVVRTALEQRIDHAYLKSLEEQVETLRRKLEETQNERDTLQLQIEVGNEERASRLENIRSEGAENSHDTQDMIGDLKNAQMSIATLQRRLAVAEEQSRTAAKEADAASELLAQCVEQHKIEKEEWETMKSADAQLSYMQSLEVELTEYRKQVKKMKDAVQRLRDAQRHAARPAIYMSKDTHAASAGGAPQLTSSTSAAAAAAALNPARVAGAARTEKVALENGDHVVADANNSAQLLNTKEVDVSEAETPTRSTKAPASGFNYACSPEEVRYMRSIIAEKDDEIIQLRQKLSESEQEMASRDDGFDALYKELCDLRQALAAAHLQQEESRSRETEANLKQTVAEDRLRQARSYAEELEESLRVSQLKYTTDVAACNDTIRQLRARVRQGAENGSGGGGGGNIQVLVSPASMLVKSGDNRDGSAAQGGGDGLNSEATGSAALARKAGARVKQLIHTATTNGRAMLLERGAAQRTFTEWVNATSRSSEGRLRLLIIAVIVLVLFITFWQSVALLKMTKGEPEPVVDERMLDKCKQWIADSIKKKQPHPA